MSKTTSLPAKCRALVVMMAVLEASAPAYAQTLVRKGWSNIESEPGKPFTAQSVSHIVDFLNGSEHALLRSGLGCFWLRV
jgi:hypothetical protein